eukprot:TRINITY_DN8028_c0_g1_i1.p1 TRINITY_DN8028_c0_g1~~TRINITY_DN8028_c0_g1_i1.p1  ORF type:complete len:202 (+),score=50.70 TRINITY_DN8028_c0_g1_i1:86-607(+)
MAPGRSAHPLPLAEDIDAVRLLGGTEGALAERAAAVGSELEQLDAEIERSRALMRRYGEATLLAGQEHLLRLRAQKEREARDLSQSVSALHASRDYARRAATTQRLLAESYSSEPRQEHRHPAGGAAAQQAAQRAIAAGVPLGGARRSPTFRDSPILANSSRQTGLDSRQWCS